MAVYSFIYQTQLLLFFPFLVLSCLLSSSFSLYFLFFFFFFSYLFLCLNILLQPPQSLFGQLQHIIRLAHREPQVIFHNLAVLIRIELGRWDGRHTDLLDQEPRQLKVSWAAGHMRRERVVLGQLDLGHVGHDKVSALGLRVRQVQLVKDGVEPRHPALHVRHAFIPEPFSLGLLEPDGTGLLERRDGRVTYPHVCCRHVSDQIGRPHQPADSPPGGVEVLTRRSNRDGNLLHLGRQCRHAGERSIEQSIVNLIREDDDLVLDADICNLLQLLLGKDLSNWVV